MLLIFYCFFIALSLLEFLDTAIAGIFRCWCCWVFFFKLCRMFMIIYCWLLMYSLVNFNFSSANKLLIWDVQIWSCILHWFITLRSILKVSQFASDLIQVAVNFNVRLSQFFFKKKPIYDGIRFPGFFQKNRFKPNQKKQKKNPYIKGLGFPVFSKKTGFNRTGPVRFEPISGPVRLIL